MAFKGARSNNKINGGSFVSNGTNMAINNESATFNIKNAYIHSNATAIYNGNWYVSNGSADPGTYNICSTTVYSNNYDINERNTGSYITYSNDNVFSNGTNTPDASKVYGSVNATGAACSW